MQSQVKSATGPAGRSYTSSIRDERARQTQRRVLDAAYALFVEHGYTPTTMAAVAARAGVSTQTVYNGFGSKAALLKRVYDVRLAGDDEDVAIADRPEVKAMHADPDPVRFLMAYADFGRVLFGRIGPFLAILVSGARAGDPELIAHLETINGERLVGTGMVARHLAKQRALRPGLTAARARDLIWTLNSVEVWQLLVGERGWSARAYAEWVGRAMCGAVLAEPRPH